MALGALALAAVAPELPSHTRLALRLTTPVSTRTSRPGDVVSAVLLANLPVDGGVIPAGTAVRGVVREAVPFTWERPQATLWLDFRELVDSGGRSVSLATRVVEVDNARESVDAEGRVLGIVPPRSRPALVEDLLLLALFLPEAFAVDTADYRLREEERPDVEYASGVEFTVETLRATAVAPTAVPAPIALDDALRLLAVDQPMRTTAGRPPRVADVTNVLLVGSGAETAAAFRAAGWATADALGLRADVKAVLAVAEHRGYREGPVAQQWLDGRLPDLVFQKQNNTFAKRHHVRLWKRPQTWQGREIWLGAATHDTGIKFVSQERTFTHAIDARLDLERQKIVDDLTFTGSAAAVLTDRPALPRTGVNATHDAIETDGRIAIVILRQPR